ncbi:thiamine pyrophosphate-binding protein [Cohaesibacter sp. CAU 1516]|uniref:thiamine pyrophosphate-binding protein n=1 Tax=Cohaesibacter sp. CAU 1516 TaxID=2576038 RepID=UPI0010FCEEB8|nr:thiamine pyrophosphate-binding protein [Cohaesibacter sp. CAU 1516]TLP46848.1 thiamine pyrophosphate-binding protein [Cohaesibacter sp. CAU 1516]
MSNRKFTGATLLVDSLVAQGASTIYGVPGESYLAVLDALHDAPTLHFVNARQEGGAAMMAEAHGKLTGEVGLCMVTRGPGATNASAGVHVAFQDSTPMILFIGQVASDQIEREAFQEIDYRRMFGQMAKWVAQIDDPARMPEFIARAYRTALSGRPGPVVLALPEDMLTTEVPAPNALPPKVKPADSAPSPDAMAELTDLLKASERPFMIIGGGGWSAEAKQAVADFAEANAIPVGVSFRCQDYFPNTHPNYAGHVGIGIDPALAARIKQSDLLLVLGARLGEMTTSGYTLIDSPVPKQTLIHIHADPEEPGRVFSPTLSIAARHATAAKMLNQLGTVRNIMDIDWVRAAHQGFEAFHAIPARKSPGDMQMAEVMKHIDANTPEGTVFTNGAGNYAIWAHRFLTYRGWRTQLAPTSGSMGYGLPAAVAAAIHDKNRPVICFAGDGCFQMTCQEFATATQEGAPIKVIVVNNGIYGTIRMHQEREYPARLSGTSLTNPDFAAMARAMGGLAETVTRTEDFAAAFARIMAHDGPALIEIITDPQALTPVKTLDEFRNGQ